MWRWAGNADWEKMAEAEGEVLTTSEAEGERQTQVAIATEESARGRRKMKKEEREMDRKVRKSGRPEKKDADWEQPRMQRKRATKDGGG
jgi:hypothetical protein